MLERTANTPLLLMVYPYKFNEFHYSLYELAYFYPHCEVVVWDISLLVNRKFTNAIASDRSQRTNVVVVEKWTDLITRILELRRQYTTPRLYVDHVIPVANGPEFLASLVLKLFLRKTKAIFIERANAGIPLYCPVGSTDGSPYSQARGWGARLQTATANLTTITELIVRSQYHFFRLLAKMVTSPITYRLVAGEQYVADNLRTRYGPNGLVLGHSDDYSRYLIRTMTVSPTAPPTTTLGVLIDGGGPMFPGDEAQTGFVNNVTSSEWYPSLTYFIDQLEIATDAHVEIAGHPKSAHPPTPDYFGNRPVHYGITQELVRNSKFVITQGSTAISYAVIYRKPLIFIYSNQYHLDQGAGKDNLLTAVFLGAIPVNIDKPPWNFEQLLQVNETQYKAYEKACLTSAGPHRPNSQIILEEIMKLTVSPRHYTNPAGTP